MKSILATVLGFLVATLPCAPALAWSHANYRGGDTTHDYGSGSTTRTNAWGGSETHSYGEGTTATGRYGNSASHQEGSDQTDFSGRYGGSATHTYGEGTEVHGEYGGEAYHPPGGYGYHAPYYGAAYPAYHPPTTVNVYGSTCAYCGGWNAAGAAAAGAAVGMAAGAAASANSAAAQSNAYAAGYNAGAQTQYMMGAIYPTLPSGCTQQPQNGQTYYLCGVTWFQPNYGANGVYYRVVPTP